MKKQEGEIGCLAFTAYWILFFVGAVLLGYIFRPVDKINHVRTPTHIPSPTPTYSGPTPADCREASDEEWANICWETIEDYYRNRQREEEYDYAPDYSDSDEPYDEPFDDERFVDGP